MKQAVNAVIVYKKFVKAAAREYGLPLETLRRKVIVARQGGGVEKKLGRPTILPEEAEEELSQILRDRESRLYGLTPTDVRRVVYKYVEKNGIAHNFNKDMQMARWYWLKDFLLVIGSCLFARQNQSQYSMLLVLTNQRLTTYFRY